MFTSLMGSPPPLDGGMILLDEHIAAGGPANTAMWGGQSAGDYIIAVGGAANPYGMRSYSVDGAGQLTYHNNISTASDCEGVHGDRNFIYGAIGARGVTSNTIDGAGAFTLKDTLNTGGFVGGNQTRDVWADDAEWDIGANTGIIYISVYGNGIRSHGVDEFGNMTNIDTLDNGLLYANIYGDGEFIYATGTFGLRSYSTASGILTHIDTDKNVVCSGSSDYNGIYGDGDYIYVANGALGCGNFVYSVDSGGNLTFEGNEATEDGMEDIWTDSKGIIYSAGLTEGINSYSEDAGWLTHLEKNIEGTTGPAKRSVWGDGTFLFSGAHTTAFVVSCYGIS